MTFRLGGLSSGLDTQALIQQLMQIERQPLVNMETRQHQIELKKGLLSEINSSLSSLNSKLETLFQQLTFKPIKATSTDDDVVSVTTDEGAIPGIYRFEVVDLATATTVSSNEALDTNPDTAAELTSYEEVRSNPTEEIDPTQAFTDAGFDSAITDGTITINGVNFSIDADVTTVDEFMSMVNGDPNTGVTISYDSVNDIFTIVSDDVGADATITISDDTGFFEAAKLTEGTYNGSGTIDPDAKLADTGLNLNPVDDTIYFKINGHAFSFDVSVYSLNRVIEEVNNSNAGVTMFYDGDADKVFISNKDTGDTAITFEDIQGTFLQGIKVDSAPQNLGTQAHFYLNDVEMYKDSNEFEINGVTFNLLKDGNSTAKVTVERDVDAIYNSIKEFVDQYNTTITLLNTRLSEEKVEGATSDAMLSKGLLRGDSTVFGIRSRLRYLATEQVDGLVNVYNSLSDIGITTTSDDYGKSGRLEIDEDKLKDAIRDNPDAVKNLFLTDTDEDEKVDDGELGVGANLYNMIQSYISTSTASYAGRTYKVGILPMRLDSMQQEIKNYDSKMEDFQVRLEIVEARYWRQFNAMEKALSQLNNQGNWLMGQLAALPSEF